MTVQELRRLLAPMNGKAVVVMCENPAKQSALLSIVGAIETAIDVRNKGEEQTERVPAVVIVGA